MYEMYEYEYLLITIKSMSMWIYVEYEYTLHQCCPLLWLRSQIWLIGKIYLTPLHFTLCNAFWLRRVKRVQRKSLERYCTVYSVHTVRCRNSMLLAMILQNLHFNREAERNQCICVRVFSRTAHPIFPEFPPLRRGANRSTVHSCMYNCTCVGVLWNCYELCRLRLKCYKS